MDSGNNLRSLPKSHSASPQPPAQLPSSSSLGSLLDGEDTPATPSKPPHKNRATPRRGAKKSKVKDERYEEDLDEDPIPTDVASRKRPRRFATKNVELEAEAKDPDFNPKNIQDADPIDYPSLLTSQVRTRQKTREAAEKAKQKALTLADETLLAREEAERREFLRVYVATNGPVTIETWSQFIRAVPAELHGDSQSWSFMLRDTTEVKQEVKPKVEAFKGDCKEGIKSELEDDKVMTSAQAEKRQIKYESDDEDRKVGDFLIREHQDMKDERQNESDGGDISPFVVKPGFWDGLRTPEQGSNDDDRAVSEASGEGESLISASDFEPEDEFNFQPEPGTVNATKEHVIDWLGSKPETRFAPIQIHEGPKDTFGPTIILFGLPTKVVLGTKGDLDFIPYGFPAGTAIWQAEYGFVQWKGFREISQALFFRHGGLNSWMYRDLLPDPTLSFDGCSSCQKSCSCWWINMRYFRRELKEDIINDRMVLWVAQVVERNPPELLATWSNSSEGNSSRRRTFWRSQLQEDVLEIFAPLRPGVDIQTIICEPESSVWKRWLFDSAAWLADDIFVYHVAQGNLGKDVSRVVFDRFAKLRDLSQFQYVPISLETLPTRGMFKSPGQ